jgi:hypothetical protein
VFAITSAVAPAYPAAIATCGGASSGYCSIGETVIATAPASTISSDMTDDRIGRSMKKWVNTARRYFFGVSAALIGVAGAAIVTGCPGTTFSTPSTTTRSPACNPCRITMSFSP